MQPALLSSSSREWYTPAWLVALIREFFDGQIDLDPCADPNLRVGAIANYIGLCGEDGLTLPWHGRTFVNPPYGRGGVAGKWVDKAQRERWSAETVLLLPARTGARWFDSVWSLPLVFLRGRLAFDTPDGPSSSATFDSVLAYVGERDYAFFNTFRMLGHEVRPMQISFSLPFSPARSAA